MLALRELVFKAASRSEGVGTIQETLKWGEPSYLTVGPNSGTAIRMNWHRDRPGVCSLFFHCQTDMIATCQTFYPALFDYDGNRRLSFSVDRPMPEEALQHCMALALTYHRRKRS